MTQAIVFIYLADVSSKLAFVLLAFAIAIGIMGLMTATIVGDKPSTDLGVKAVVVAFTLSVVAAILPGKQTLYVAAGASATSAAVESVIGQKVLRALETVIDNATKEADK